MCCGVRVLRPRPCGVPRPGADSPVLSWIRDERMAMSGVWAAQAVACLAGQGVTRVVKCRPQPQVAWSGDLAAEWAAFGPGRVAHTPMHDHGLRQRPAVRAVAYFAARVPDYQPQAEVLIHCSEAGAAVALGLAGKAVDVQGCAELVARHLAPHAGNSAPATAGRRRISEYRQQSGGIGAGERYSKAS